MLEPLNPTLDFDEPSAETLLRDAEAHIRHLEALLVSVGIPCPPRIAEPHDSFGAHIIGGSIGAIGNREIGPGHVVLSEERYQWLLSHVPSDEVTTAELAAMELGMNFFSEDDLATLSGDVGC